MEVIEGDKVALQQAGEQAEINLKQALFFLSFFFFAGEQTEINLEQALLYSSLTYIYFQSVGLVMLGDQVE